MERKISLVIPVHNEEGNLEELYKKITLQKGSSSWELIFIDDGSSDKSLKILKSLAAADKRVKLIVFRRNFGQTAAISAGFNAATADILVSLDADLQNDPADIAKMLTLVDNGFDVVCGWRKNRKDNFLYRKLPSYLANKLISWVTGLKLHDYGCTLKVYRAEIVKDIHLYGEMHRFLPALASWVGGRIVEVPVQHHPRIRGSSKYNITRTFKVLIDLMTVKFLMNYSTKPNYIFGGMGIVSLLLGFLAFSVVAYRVIVLQRLAATPLVFIMTILFIAGIQLLLMGLLAEMQIRTHFESQNKKIYFIKEKVNF